MFVYVFDSRVLDTNINAFCIVIVMRVIYMLYSIAKSELHPF